MGGAMAYKEWQLIFRLCIWHALVQPPHHQTKSAHHGQIFPLLIKWIQCAGGATSVATSAQQSPGLTGRTPSFSFLASGQTNCSLKWSSRLSLVRKVKQLQLGHLSSSSGTIRFATGVWRGDSHSAWTRMPPSSRYETSTLCDHNTWCLVTRSWHQTITDEVTYLDVDCRPLLLCGHGTVSSSAASPWRAVRRRRPRRRHCLAPRRSPATSWAGARAAAPTGLVRSWCAACVL